MSTAAYIAISVLEAVLLVLALALALLRVRQRLTAIAAGLATFASILAAVDRDLRLLRATVPRMSAPLSGLAGALPGLAEKAEAAARR